VIPGGTHHDDPIHSMDILRTSLSAASVEVKPEWELEGVDLLPLLKGQKESLDHRFLYFRLNNNWAIRDPSHKLTKMSGKRWFTNIKNDISEKHNLLKKKPELAAEFEKKMKAWDSENEPARWGWNRHTCKTFIGYRNFKTIEDLEAAQKNNRKKK
jgi:arylsulfatase A-like enzyme